MGLYELIKIIHIYSPLPAAILLAVFWKSLDKDAYYLAIYIGASLFVNLASTFLTEQLIFGYYIQSYFGLLVIILFGIMISNFTNNRGFLRFVAIGVLVYVLALTVFDKTNQLPRISLVICFLLQIIYCFYYYYFLYRNEQEVFIEGNLRFMMVSALLIFASGAFFTFLFLDVVSYSRWLYFYTTFEILSILSMLVFALVVWKNYKNQNSELNFK